MNKFHFYLNKIVVSIDTIQHNLGLTMAGYNDKQSLALMRTPRFSGKYHQL